MRTIKLVVIGASGVGKTSLRNQYISGRFTTGYRATIGADFITKTIPHHANPDEKVTLQIWDTAGQERFSSLSSAFFRGADAVLLMFDVNQPQTLDALSKWWSEFRDRAPVPDEEINKFCCVFVGNKIDVPPPSPGNEVPAGLAAATGNAAVGGSSRVGEVQAQVFIDELIPPPACTPILAPDSLAFRPPKDDEAISSQATHSPSPPHTSSIDIAIYSRRRRHSRSRSRSTLFRGGTIGTMTTTHTLSVYQTPSSSFFDVFESARSSPAPPSAISRQSSPLSSRSPSHSPVRSPHRKPSMSSTVSDTQTITPSLFVNGNGRAASTTCTTPNPAPSPVHTLPAYPAPPQCGTKLFFTSAKTGVGVADVFEYVARRVVGRWEYEEAVDARTLHVAEASIDSNTVRLRGTPSDRSSRCCGS